MFVETHTSLLDRWHRLGTRIRCALEPEEPRLLELYLFETRYLVAWEPLPAWQLFEKSYQLLLDTAADIALPWHWRNLCLDHAYRPLHELRRLASDAEHTRRLRQLAGRLAAQPMAPSLTYHDL